MLRYCARPAFALERLREIDSEPLVYESVKPGPGGSLTLMLTPIELLDRLAALIPPPRRHRHRYFGVLAPHAPLRTASQHWRAGAPKRREPRHRLRRPAHRHPPHRAHPPRQHKPRTIHRQAARYAWALLLARIYEIFPLLCPKRAGEIRIVAFITEASAVREIFACLGEPTSPPRMAPVRGMPLWERIDVGQGECDPQAPNRRWTTSSIRASPGSARGTTPTNDRPNGSRQETVRARIAPRARVALSATN